MTDTKPPRRPSFTIVVRRGLRMMSADSSLLNNADRTGPERNAIRRARAYIEEVSQWHDRKRKESADDS